MWKAKINAHKVVQDRLSKCNEQLLIEKPIQCILNGTTLYSGSSTPEQRDHIFWGYLIASHGPQSLPEEIEKDGDTLSLTVDPVETSREGDAVSLKISDVKHLMALFQDNVQLYKETGIAESAAICTKTETTHFADDIERLNAMYKVLSFANQSKDWGEDILVISGKLCHRVLGAAVRCGIRTIISRTGITSAAYDLATEHDICTIGFCRGKHFTIYTGRDQILDG